MYLGANLYAEIDKKIMLIRNNRDFQLQQLSKWLDSKQIKPKELEEQGTKIRAKAKSKIEILVQLKKFHIGDKVVKKNNTAIVGTVREILLSPNDFPTLYIEWNDELKSLLPETITHLIKVIELNK